MKQNEYVFSLDGIATERYLNKKGYYINPSAINEHMKKHNQEYLDNAGGLFIINNEKQGVGATKIILEPSDNHIRYMNNTPHIKFLNERLERKKKFNCDVEKIYKVNSSYLNIEKFNQVEAAVLFKNPFVINFMSAKLQIFLENKIFFKRQKLKKYKLYKIHFTTYINTENSFEKQLYDRSCGSFDYVYYGITQRDVFQRFIEHKKKAEDNSGYLFHKIWNKLFKLRQSKLYISLFILKDSDSLDEIYDYEEAFVDFDSLYPMGCNAIPGGHAGIRELHKLNLLGSTKNVSLKDRDKAIERYVARGYKIQNRKSAAPHDRTGYTYFKPSLNRYVTVSKCRVNSKFDTGVYSS
tara:strand:- start:368 stop:1423 length:1056 start_codon:yes stop_codon:yes gene_type:complete